MNKILMLLCSTLFLMSCKQPVKLISAVKQTVIPGRPNLEKYNNYVVEFLLKEDVTLAIDSVKVIEENKSYTSNFTLKKKGASSYTKSLNEKGSYILEVSLRKQNIIKSNLETSERDKLIVFYLEDNQPQQVEISKFKTETVTRR